MRSSEVGHGGLLVAFWLLGTGTSLYRHSRAVGGLVRLRRRWVRTADAGLALSFEMVFSGPWGISFRPAVIFVSEPYMTASVILGRSVTTCYYLGK